MDHVKRILLPHGTQEEHDFYHACVHQNYEKIKELLPKISTAFIFRDNIAGSPSALHALGNPRVHTKEDHFFVVRGMVKKGARLEYRTYGHPSILEDACYWSPNNTDDIVCQIETQSQYIDLLVELGGYFSYCIDTCLRSGLFSVVEKHTKITDVNCNDVINILDENLINCDPDILFRIFQKWMNDCEPPYDYHGKNIIKCAFKTIPEIGKKFLDYYIERENYEYIFSDKAGNFDTELFNLIVWRHPSYISRIRYIYKKIIEKSAKDKDHIMFQSYGEKNGSNTIDIMVEYLI